MGFKLAALIGLLLFASLASFKMYYDKTEAQKLALVTQLQQSMDNQGLIERIVNKGTARVGKDLQNLTNPEQFDEEIITDSVIPE